MGRKDPPKVGPQKTVLEYRCEECGKYDYIYEHDNPSTQEPDDRPTIN